MADGAAVELDVVNTFPSLPPDDNGSNGGSDSDLASTGGPSLIFLGVGVLLLIAGGTLIAARHRRG